MKIFPFLILPLLSFPAFAQDIQDSSVKELAENIGKCEATYITLIAANTVLIADPNNILDKKELVETRDAYIVEDDMLETSFTKIMNAPEGIVFDRDLFMRTKTAAYTATHVDLNDRLTNKNEDIFQVLIGAIKQATTCLHIFNDKSSPI